MCCRFLAVCWIRRYNSNARTQGWTQGEVLQSLNHARMWVTAIAEGASGYSYHTLQGLRVDEQNTPLLALCNVHTLARLGLGTPNAKAERLYLGNNSGWIAYRFDIRSPTGMGVLPRESGVECSMVVAVWPRDGEFASQVTVTVTLQDVTSNVSLSVLSQWGNTVPLDASATSATFALDRGVNYLCLRDDWPAADQVAAAIVTTLVALPAGPPPSVAWPQVPTDQE